MQNENDRIGDSFPLSSRLYLPKRQSAPATILAHLIAHFRHVSPKTWRDRVRRGLIIADDGTTVGEDSAYRHGLTIFYRKEVPGEPKPVREADIVYADAEILVADKPHGMLVRPAGNHVQRSLLVRLRQTKGLAMLAPVHHLDRDTAGIVLFTLQPGSRGAYHRLFADGTIEREYLAVAHIIEPPDRTHWCVENRLGTGEPWYRRKIVEGPAHAISEIDLLDSRGGMGLFRIRPRTGKKHQIRVHMATIGFPIVNDNLYPEIAVESKGGSPLQLLAFQLSFSDPLSGSPRVFRSRRQLLWKGHREWISRFDSHLDPKALKGASHV